MDRLNRLTNFNEWQIDSSYMWRKDTSWSGPYVCVDTNARLRTVTLEDHEGADITYPASVWTNRFVPLVHAFECCAIAPGGSVPVDVLEKQIKQYRIDYPPKRTIGHCCGNCAYFEPALDICCNDKNRSKGPNDDCAHVGWSSWCPHWDKDFGRNFFSLAEEQK